MQTWRLLLLSGFMLEEHTQQSSTFLLGPQGDGRRKEHNVILGDVLEFEAGGAAHSNVLWTQRKLSQT